MKDFGLHIETQYTIFEAKLDDESYRRDKNRHDKTLEEFMKTNWGMATTVSKNKTKTFPRIVMTDLDKGLLVSELVYCVGF